MKYKKILFIFLAAVCCCLPIRTMQVFYTIEGSTGFFKRAYAEKGFIMGVAIFSIAAVAAIIGFTVQRCPMKMPKVNPMLGISSIALGAGIVYELVNTTFSSRIPAWQVMLLDITGILSAVFFVAYGAKFIYDYRLPRKLYILPILYWMIKLIFAFTVISPLALIMDNVFMMVSYCAVLVFMLEFAKLANDRDPKLNHKKLMASAICAVLFCLCVAFPRVVAILMGKSGALHESLASLLPTLTVAIFIALFTLSHFSNFNLSKHHHRRSSRHRAPGMGMNSFYLGESKQHHK